MCGIVGMAFDALGGDRQTVMQRMLETLRRRGPDGEGMWQDDRVIFGHTRLAIIDLSPLGEQPMRSADGRWVITFNGEIYNYEMLRDRLIQEGCTFQSHSDTEVLLYACASWGIEKTLREARGMFAFGLWDSTEKTLYLARDRFGEKPLCYGWQGKTFLFASQLTTLLKYPNVSKAIHEEVLASYLQNGYFPTPHMPYRDFKKLLPGHYMVVKEGREEKLFQYASLVDDARVAKAASTQTTGDPTSSDIDELQTLLMQSVRRCSISDVPLGAFLSGGIDSSLVVALLCAQQSKVKTFSIGFGEAYYNEAPFAKAIANYLGTDHTELFVSDQETRDAVFNLPDVYDEPFADSSQLPTLLLSKLTKKHVTVSLSGDGGDECFGGYQRYYYLNQYYRWFTSCPRPLRHLVGFGLRALPDFFWQRLYALTPLLKERSVHVRGLLSKARRLGYVLPACDHLETFYESMISSSHEVGSLLSGEHPLKKYPRWCDTSFFENKALFPVERMMLADALFYLLDDILVKVDRAGMHVGLETRIPFLDPEVFSWIWSKPLSFRMKGSSSKHILRLLLRRLIPEALWDRPKMGFGIPLNPWLRQGWRAWSEDVLASDHPLRDMLDMKACQMLWQKHQSGLEDHGTVLWHVLMLIRWFQVHH